MDILSILVQAAIGYGRVEFFSKSFGGHLHSMNLVILAILCTLSFMEIIAMGVEWYQPKHVVMLGVIIALLYMEIIQCWETQICTWGGLGVFFLIPYRLRSYGWYTTIIADFNEHPETYRTAAANMVDHPLTHVTVVGLVTADFFLLFIELLIDTGNIGETIDDKTLAMMSLSKIRRTIYVAFAFEIVLEMFVKGLSYFTRLEHLVDAIVVYACLFLEMTVPLDNNDNDYVQLIMLLRLWRVFRIIYGVHVLVHEKNIDLEMGAESTIVQDTIHTVQGKLDPLIDTASSVTGGVSDRVVGGISHVTGVHEFSDEDLDEMHIEFKTLVVIVYTTTVTLCVFAFVIMYCAGKFFREPN